MDPTKGSAPVGRGADAAGHERPQDSAAAGPSLSDRRDDFEIEARPARSLTHYDAARSALAEAHRVDEVKDIRDKAQAMAAYARLAKDTAMVEWATEIKVRAERRAGEMLREAAERGERATPGTNQHARSSHDATTSPTLAAIGITRSQSSRWQKLAAIPEAKFEQAVTAAKETAREVTTAAMLRLDKPHVSHNSGENEWYTPPDYIEAARAAMGGIDCDPASSEVANRTVRAARYFTKEQDGLTKKWSGAVWMNPPYAQPLIAQFSEAVASKFESGEIEQACVLVNNATETEWFQRLLSVCTSVYFPRSRVRFLDPEGNPGGAPLQGQAVIYMGKRAQEFAATFGGLGAVFTHWGKA